MKYILSITFILTLIVNTSAQISPIYTLEQKLKDGNKQALLDIAPYFDSKKEITEFLGYHIIQTTESEVAKRIVEENCIFLKTEIVITPKTTAKEFKNFLNNNFAKITFSKLATAFLITPLEKRSARVEFREMSKFRLSGIEDNYSELLNSDWVKQAKIDAYIKKKDPKALLLIASQLYQKRYRFNNSSYDQHEFIALLQVLTHFEIAVEDDRGELTWHVDKEFYSDATLNLLIYFANNYSNFTWDAQSSTFKNSSIILQPINKENELFHLLKNENDSIAIDAFTQLTTADPGKVAALSTEFDRASIESNYSLPTFPYRFLTQISALTDYCIRNKFNFTGSHRLNLDIQTLESNLSFTERRKLEDSLINNLTLDQITALEYWALIKEESWELTYSTGRILDIFYSKNWHQLINDENYLKLYLKKSLLFDRLGIIGICNNYLKKFINNGTNVSAYLAQLQSEDADIKFQIEGAKKNCMLPLQPPRDSLKVNDGNRDYAITNLKKKIEEIKNKDTTAEKREDELIELLSKITYDQIGIALRAIEGIPFVSDQSWKKYSFMDRDWGILIDDNFDSLATRINFLEQYDKLKEHQLYAYYLDKAGIKYKNSDGSLNYDKIYEILKYNVVTAFVGGGGGRRDNEVYSIIKILELSHQTTLGYPKKLCNSNGMYACDAHDRAQEWMHYIMEKNYLDLNAREPVSFNYK